MKIMRAAKKIIIFTALFIIFFFRASNLFAEDIIETLMGTDVAPRKKFIFDHALDVSNLDI